MDKIKVILNTPDEIIRFFHMYHDQKSMTILQDSSCITDAARLINENLDAVVVVDTISTSRHDVDGLIKLMTQKDVIFVVIVPDIKQGFEYLNKGATEMITWPAVFDDTNHKSFIQNLCLKIKIAQKKHIEYNSRTLKYTGQGLSNKVLAFGSSTGGTETMSKILKELPESCPPIVIVQHMPPVFTKLYAERLNSICAISVWEAHDGDIIKPGLALIAPGDKHMRLINNSNGFSVEVSTGENVNGHCPSVDVLFNSVADVVGSKAVGVILTGMGSDGAKGLLHMRQKGAVTIGQDRDSSVVYGMPKVAYDIGAVCYQVGLDNMVATIMEHL